MTVMVDVPAEARSLRLLRLAAADAAAAAGFDMDRVETARLVMDELASVVMTDGGGRLRVSITRNGDRTVQLEGHLVGHAPTSVTPDFIVRELLDASIGPGTWSVDQDAEQLGFRASVGQRRRSD